MRSFGMWLLRGVISLVNSETKMQSVQSRLMAGGAKDAIEHFEPYGFTSCPHDGAEAILGFLGGDPSHGVAIVVADRRFRLQGLGAGEVALYTDEGDSLVFKRGRLAELNTRTLRINASEKVEINSPVVEASQDVLAKGKFTGQGGMAISGGEGATVDGTLRATVDVIAAGKSTVHHRHPETGSISEEPQ